MKLTSSLKLAALLLTCLTMTACKDSGGGGKPGSTTPNTNAGPKTATGTANNTSGQVTFTPIVAPTPKATAKGWLHWRGPQQDGTSQETNLPDKISTDEDGGNLLWTHESFGRGTPVINGNRVYSWGYDGEGAELREQLTCLDAETGKILWQHKFNDFISDIIYDRYSIGSPTIDPETGNVYLQTTNGLLIAFDADGKHLWEISLMEEFGRLTFPNGRTGSPVIDGDLLIARGITTNWGAQGPPRDRFYAFDKRTGQAIWSSTPGVGPPFLKDSSFSNPMLVSEGDRRVFYVGLGCGNVAKVDARTGEPIWRYQFSVGGVNSAVLLHKDKVIAIHGKENLDSSKAGRMVALKRNATPTPTTDRSAPTLSKADEVWRNDKVLMFTSSPILVGDRIYQMVATGELFCIDANTGKTLWHEKLGTSQIHASPLFADGKLYVPMNEGLMYVLKPSDTGVEELSKIRLQGNCLGAPAIWNGKVYVHTTRKLYCFGTKGDNAGAPKGDWPIAATPAGGKAVELRAMPSEVILRPGTDQSFDVQAIDANGVPVETVTGASWAKFIPPTAKVKAEMDADFVDGKLTAKASAVPSAGAYKVTAGELSGVIRGRILAGVPYNEDFEAYDINVKHATEDAMFAYPPLAWIGARFKWEVRENDGSKVLAKTLSPLILQRATTFFGPSSMSNYTLQADVKTDGNRRQRSDVGLVNQRYIIVLKGNHREIEINSNQERIKVNTRFPFDPKKWYTLKTRVDIAEDGSGVVRAKAWERGTDEPADWTLEVPHSIANKHGSPGFFGFAQQGKHRVYIDNIKLTSNAKAAE